MSKTELEELIHIRKEIAQLEKRIARIEKQSTRMRDVNIKEQLQDYYEKLNKLYTMLIDKAIEIEDYIQTIKFSEIRQIFRLKYIDGLNWVQVAHEMNNTYKRKVYSEDSVRHKHNRYLKKYQI